MTYALFEILNSRRLAIFIFGLILCFLSGCSTIQFVQIEQEGNTSSVNPWHHSTLNGMVEISKPLNIKSICGEKTWATITTERTFYNVAVNFLVPQVSVFYVYDAWTNKVKCYDPTLTEPKESSLTPPAFDITTVTISPDSSLKHN